ncbi:MAG: glycosyltransferase family 2 protein [Flavobacteriales bacterium]|jgi:glycosyltransferase involved in cell wall biosynthesis|nr:glycosyltransferase [Flavobacteriales bacterium]MBP9161081.1 glycosyltransferase [Flavobacteriales bacterium]
MKVSVITVCYNSVTEIEETIRSVMVQDHADIEHIVIDGGSTDGTQDKIKRYSECISHFVSEKDAGVYDAMNKGLKLATGDVVAFVNAGDMMATRNTVSYMVRAFEEGDCDVIYGDALMVDPDDITKVKRFWKGGEYKRENFRKGWMPPHLGTYIRKRAYDRFGLFNTELSVSADYELMFRFLYKHKLSARYVPKVLVRFRLGGVSNRSFAHVWRANVEVYKAWKLNGESVSPLIILRKPLAKVLQMVKRSG